MLPMLKTQTFTILKNDCRCLVLHLLENGSASFAIDPFTLFQHERDVREKSDSAAMSESISMSMINLLDTDLPVLVPDISPDFLT